MFKTGAMSCACTPANTDIGKSPLLAQCGRFNELKVPCAQGAGIQTRIEYS